MLFYVLAHVPTFCFCFCFVFFLGGGADFTWYFNDVTWATWRHITGDSTTYSTTRSGWYQRKFQTSAVQALIWRIHRWLMACTHKGPVIWTAFPWHDVLITSGEVMLYAVQWCAICYICSCSQQCITWLLMLNEISNNFWLWYLVWLCMLRHKPERCHTHTQIHLTMLSPQRGLITTTPRYIDGILPKGPYPPYLRMADRTLSAGYPRCSLDDESHSICHETCTQFWCDFFCCA